jgi:hypothetical protein
MGIYGYSQLLLVIFCYLNLFHLRLYLAIINVFGYSMLFWLLLIILV